MLTALATALALAAAPSVAGLDAAKIEQLTGAAGAADASEGALVVSAPRGDLDVYLNEQRLTPALGLRSWAGFKRAAKGVVVAGQLALVDDQVSPALAALQDGGLEVTSIDHHFLRESPRVTFVHFAGQGEEQPLARAVGKAFEAAKPKSGPASPKLAELEVSGGTLDAKKLAALLGGGEASDGTFQLVRARAAKLHGNPAGAALGAASSLALTGSDGSAFAAGAVAATEAELQPVLRALREAGLNVASIDATLPGDAPRLVRFTGTGPAEKLAAGFKAALAQTHP